MIIYFNTSNVNNQPNSKELIEVNKNYFNTSNVNNQPNSKELIEVNKNYFNTSNVNNQRSLAGIQLATNEFQYIKC